MSDTETFKQIMNMEIHTLDETSMNNVSKMWCFIEKQNEKIAERDARIAELEKQNNSFYEEILELRGIVYKHEYTDIPNLQSKLSLEEKEGAE